MAPLRYFYRDFLNFHATNSKNSVTELNVQVPKVNRLSVYYKPISWNRDNNRSLHITVVVRAHSKLP